MKSCSFSHMILFEIGADILKTRYFYPAVFTYEAGQEIAVTFPDLDAATSGTDEDEALLSARELMGCVLVGLEEDGKELPAPSRLTDIELQPNERAVLVDVFMPSVRQARANRSVSRTVTLPAWMNAAALERNINFSQVLQDALRAQLDLRQSGDRRSAFNTKQE